MHNQVNKLLLGLRTLLLTLVVASGILADALSTRPSSWACTPSVLGNCWWNSHNHEAIAYTVIASAVVSLGVYSFVKAYLGYRHTSS